MFVIIAMHNHRPRAYRLYYYCVIPILPAIQVG